MKIEIAVGWPRGLWERVEVDAPDDFNPEKEDEQVLTELLPKAYLKQEITFVKLLYCDNN